MRRIKTVPELYAHALAIEAEAAARYAEFAERMSDEGREDLARVFALLAREEAEHIDALQRRTEGVELPQIADGHYHWLDKGSPEAASHELILRLMTPRHALAIALHAERKAQAFFEHVYWTCDDPGLRALAKEMSEEEREHAALIAQLLESTPNPSLDRTVIFQK